MTKRDEALEKVANYITAVAVLVHSYPGEGVDTVLDLLDAALGILMGEIKEEPEDVDEENWTEEWPTEPGWYWFIGRLHHWCDEELRSVRVYVSGATRSGVVYETDGRFIYEDESAGVWCPAVLPEPPHSEEVKE